MERMHLRFEESEDLELTRLIFSRDADFVKKVLEIEAASLVQVKLSKSSPNLIIMTSVKDIKYRVALETSIDESDFLAQYHRLEGQVKRQRSACLRSHLVLHPNTFQVRIERLKSSRTEYLWLILRH